MDLAAAVKCLASVKDLNKDLLLAAWEKGCPSPEEKNKDQELSYKDLVSQYKKSQSVQRLGGQSSKAVKARAQSVHYFSLNFSTYRRKLSSFSKTSPNVQVIGFTENDSYIDVLRRDIKWKRGQCQGSVSERVYSSVYSPIFDVGDQVCSSVVAVGCIGVWRMISYDFGRSDLSVCGDLALAVPAFQPEDHKYLIMEISCNGDSELKSNLTPGSTKAVRDVRYEVKGKQYIRSRAVSFLSTEHCSPLLLISPNHGTVSYVWKRKGATGDTVYANTCLLYVGISGTYTCSVDEQTFEFEVKGMSKERSGGDMKVAIEELKFEDIIGRGSFAVVNKGMWKGAQVALKCISVPGSISAGIPKEVEILRELNHPNIINILAYSVTPQEVVLVTNYMDGCNLDKILFGKNKIQHNDWNIAFYVLMTSCFLAAMFLSRLVYTASKSLYRRFKYGRLPHRLGSDGVELLSSQSNPHTQELQSQTSTETL